MRVARNDAAEPPRAPDTTATSPSLPPASFKPSSAVTHSEQVASSSRGQTGSQTYRYNPDSDWGPPIVQPPDDDVPSRNPRNNAATAASAAGVRALSAQLVAFYFRAPAKAFFRTRVDYLAYARSVHQARTEALMRSALADSKSAAARGAASGQLASFARAAWFWARGTTPGVITSVVRHHGWSIVPQQILPPLVANVGVGAVLYTSYLHILGRLHGESGKASKRTYPPPPPAHTFTAGLLAGSLQSIIAAPLDALQARYDHRDMMPSDGSGRPRSMWSFGGEKLREIGLRGVFAGWGLSLAKDGLGSAVFFSTFEYVKAQAYYRFVTWYYGGLADDMVDLLAMKRPTHRQRDAETAIIRPHYALEPMFLLLAGSSASFAQQVVLHPLSHFQVKHWDRLEEIDERAARFQRPSARPATTSAAAAASAASAASTTPSTGAPARTTNTCGTATTTAPVALRQRRFRMLRLYYRAYQETLAECTAEAASEGMKLTRWLYRGFWWNTIRQVPSTSAGLIIFELIRRKYGIGTDEVRITKDGYDILLS